MRKKEKIIIFDLDETIGYFQDLSMLFYKEFLRFPNASERDVLFGLLEINPGIFRINIFEIFTLIINAKKNNHSIKTVLFTNNQGPRLWYNLIVDYIHYKLDYELFDVIIGPYKIGNEVVEKERTTHNKSIYDLSIILRIPVDYMDVIIFDDQKHTNMTHKNVLYVKLKPYIHYVVEDTQYIKDYFNMREKILYFIYFKN